jgi:hypothetical protein
MYSVISFSSTLEPFIHLPFFSFSFLFTLHLPLLFDHLTQFQFPHHSYPLTTVNMDETKAAEPRRACHPIDVDHIFLLQCMEESGFKVTI